jgi:adenylate cyclase
MAAGFSIVVLPFVALNSEPGQDYIADTLTEDLTTNLARLARGAVIAPSTAFTYKGKPVDVKQLRRELGVRYVLEGSEQHDHDRLRVDAQLIDAISGTNLWADQFDADRADLPQMQDQIVTELLRSLQFKVTDIEGARLAQTPPADLTAEELAMRCNAGLTESMIGRKAETALALCERALQIDPRNVRALTVLAEGTIIRVNEFQSSNREADIQRADDLVSRALAVDRNSYAAHATKAEVLMAEKRFDEAIFEAEQALALDPSFVSAYTTLSTVSIFLGRPEKAVAYADTAMRLSPRDPQLFLFHFQKGLALLLEGKNDQAVEWLSRTVAAAPDWPLPFALLAAALAEAGRKPDAEVALKRYLSLNGGRNGTIALWVAQLPSDNPDFRQAVGRVIDGLRKAGMPER